MLVGVSHSRHRKRLDSELRKIDDYVKSEMQRLSSRLDANEARIARLVGTADNTGLAQCTWKHLFTLFADVADAE